MAQQARPERFLVYAHEILALVWVKRWRIFIDTWTATSGA
jgi:hypothetical protein